MLFEIKMAHTAIFADLIISVGQLGVRDQDVVNLPICTAQFFKNRFHADSFRSFSCGYLRNDYSFPITAVHFATNEPQSCVFCEG